jgi:hypothetical protein
MKLRLPSPSMAVSVAALVVAMGGSAFAASKVLITSSSQIRQGAVESSDIKNGSLKGADLAGGTITADKLKAASISGDKLRADVRSQLTKPATTSATEVVRGQGPTQAAATGGSAVVATLKGLAPGSYLLTAKTVLASASGEQKGLLDAVLNSETHTGKCRLEAGDNADESMGTIISPASKSPANLHLQMTRTVSAPTDVVLRCESDTPWSAGGTSIVAVALGTSTRTSVDG